MTGVHRAGVKYIIGSEEQLPSSVEAEYVELSRAFQTENLVYLLIMNHFGRNAELLLKQIPIPGNI